MTSFDIFLESLTRTSNLFDILDDGFVEFPLREDRSYWCTPKNAVIFGWTGVDGIHYTILKIEDDIREDSPILRVSPTDFEEPFSLLGRTFVDFLAIGCTVDRQIIEGIIEKER